MPDNSQPRHDATPKQDGSFIGRNLGEAIYARHAQFVWPTSIASSLAHRFAPFTDERLPLAMVVQRRWSVASSSVARMPDLYWLQAFAPGSPRHAVSARPQASSRTIATSDAPSPTSPSAGEVTLAAAPETSRGPAAELAPSAQTSEATRTAFVTNAATHESASAHRPSEISRQITGLSVPASPNRVQADLASPVAELAHRLRSDVSRSAENEIVPTANSPQELGTVPVSRVAQEEPVATHRSSEVSGQVGPNSAPAVPQLQSASDVRATSVPNRSDRALGQPVTVYNAPPIIRRSFASRQAEAARAESTGRQISDSSTDVHEATAQRSADEVPVQRSMSAESALAANSMDRAISKSADSQSENIPGYSVAAWPIARDTQTTGLHYINQSSGESRIQNAVSKRSEVTLADQSTLTVEGQLQRSAPVGNLQSAAPADAPGEIVSRERTTSHEPSIMMHAVVRSHEASTDAASPHKSVVARSLAQGEQAASLSRLAVPDSAPMHMARQPMLQEAHETNTVARKDEVHDHTVVPESHSDAPAVAMLHRHESAERAPTGPSTERAVESNIPPLPSSLLRAENDFVTDRSTVDRLPATTVPESRVAGSDSSPSILHLQHESVSSSASSADSVERSRASIAGESSPELNQTARSHANNSVPASTTNSTSAAPPIHAPSYSSVASLSRSNVERSTLLRRSEPTFRSTSATLCSAGTGVASGSSSGSAIYRDTTMPLVVQESAVVRTTHAEPLVLSRAISGGSFQHLSRSSLAAGIEPSASSPAIATRTIGFLHRSPSMVAQSTSFQAAGATHFESLPLARQAAADPTFSKAQIPSPPSMSAGAASAPSSSPTSPDITQLANRVYEILVRRLASERQRRGR